MAVKKRVRPEKLVYAADERPPLFSLSLLGLQLICVLSIYLVLVVIVARAAHATADVVQSMVSMGMLALGVGSFLQALWRGPIGSGYLAPPVVSAIYLPSSILAVQSGGLPVLFGMTALAGIAEVVFSRVFIFLRNFFPPVISGLIVLAVGFELGLLGADQLLDVKQEIESQNILTHVLVSFFTLGLMISLTIWARGWLRLLSPLIGILCGWLLALPMGLITADSAKMLLEASFLAMPNFSYITFDWDAKLLIPFLICSLAGGLRTIGVVTTCQRINDANWRRPDKRNIQKGILADGLGCLAAGLLGVPGTSSSPSAVGISQFTQATSRYIAFAVSVWFLLFSFFPKISVLFITIPNSVVGATLIYTGSMLLVSGIKIISSQPLDVRKTFIIGFSLFLGLSHKVSPHYYALLPSWIQMFSGTTLSITTLSAIFLNALFRIKIEKHADIAIESDHSLDQVDTFIVNNVNRWGGKVEEAKNATTFLNILSKQIIDNGCNIGPLQVKVSYDPLYLSFTIKYQGKLVDVGLKPHQHEENMLDEMPMAAGLSTFSTDVFPDRYSSKSKDGFCEITYTFETF